MKIKVISLAWIVSLAASLSANAQPLTIEPDNYADGTVLDHIRPEVSLTTVGNNNQPIPPVTFSVTAQPTPPGHASTGTKVFAEAGVNFFNDNFRLRMNFNGVVQELGLDAIGSGFTLQPERGHLEVYNSQNALIDSFVTDILGNAQIQRMSLHHGAPDIAWAVAWSEGGTFARLDNFVFSPPVPVPEPSVVALALSGILLIAVSRRGRRRRGEKEDGPRC